MYENIIEDINPKRKSTAIRLLQLLAYAERPLRLDEVAAAISTDFSQTPSILSSNKFLRKNNLPSYCPSLVLLEEVDNPDYARWQKSQACHYRINRNPWIAQEQSWPTDRGLKPRGWSFSNYMIQEMFQETVIPPSRHTVVRLAHFSVAEYLRSGIGIHDEFKEQRVHSTILKLSLGYLEFLSTILPNSSISVVRRDYSFSDYASTLWPKHAKACENDQKAQELIMRFLKNWQAVRTWMKIFNPEGYRKYSRTHHVFAPTSAEIPTPLQIATRFGLSGVFEALLGSTVPLSEQVPWSTSGIYDNQLLQAFYIRGCPYNPSIVPEGPLLRTGPLYIACHHGWEDIVMILLDKGLDLNDHTGPNGSPFVAACEQGHSKLVHRLADIEACQKRDASQRNLQVTRLFIRGYWKPLKALLDVGVVFPPSTTDFEVSRVFIDWSSEHIFIISRLMDLILETISWIKCPTGSDMVRRVLQAKSKLASLMELAIPFIKRDSEPHLIEVIVHSEGAVLGSELYEAVRKGDITFLRAVLPRWKGLFKSCDQREKSPLHYAAEMGHTDTVKILISAGFSLDVTDKSANRPLSFSYMNRHTHLLDLLSPYQGSIKQ